MTSPDEISFKEKLRSVSFSTGRPAPKKRTDVHDSHVVEVTEHWNDRVDVAVKPSVVEAERRP